jgi:hypothetical protein
VGIHKIDLPNTIQYQMQKSNTTIMFSTAIRSLYSGIQNWSNPAYQHKQDIGDDFKYGSRNYFGTDCAINGEYFRSKSKNEYYNIVDKESPAKDISELTFFIPSEKLPERLKMWKYDPEKHLIVRLAFDKNKRYFVESYQDINITDRNPDVMTVDDKELLANLPEFVPLPNSSGDKSPDGVSCWRLSAP